jgi:hypothetical protein
MSSLDYCPTLPQPIGVPPRCGSRDAVVTRRAETRHGVRGAKRVGRGSEDRSRHRFRPQLHHHDLRRHPEPDRRNAEAQASGDHEVGARHLRQGAGPGRADPVGSHSWRAGAAVRLAAGGAACGRSASGHAPGQVDPRGRRARRGRPELRAVLPRSPGGGAERRADDPAGT